MNNISLLIGAILSSNIYKCNEKGIVEVHIYEYVHAKRHYGLI